MTPLTNINHDIESTAPPKEDQCEKCGLFPHPVQSIRKLSAEIQSAFPVPGAENHSYIGQSKKRKLQITARHISGEDIYNQIKEKTEAKNKETSKKVSLPKRKSDERDCQLPGNVKTQRISTRLASKIKAKALGNLV